MILILVLDVAQLELRLLAHMCGCVSMLEAFELGGDFHSRTAMAMFPYIGAAVAAGDVYLEASDRAPGAKEAPLLKDKFASERRKAKILNFSIAYGKTAHGLAKDFGVSVEEAKATVDAWYAPRPEVRAWQEEQFAMAIAEGRVFTLLGRQRRLPDAQGSGPRRGHALRAAINTPIQGGAADIAMLAMLRLHSSKALEALRYRLLMQVHDEVILEGPAENAAAALAEVKKCMEKPWATSLSPDGGVNLLKVELAVDAKYAQTWYDAK